MMRTSLRSFSKVSAAIVVAAVMVVSACGANSKSSIDDADDGGTDAGGTGQGGASGSGARGGTGGTATGGTATGGTGGTVAGSGGCGPCLRIACAPPVWLTIVPDAASGAPPIADLTVDVPGLTLSCNSSGSATSCQWLCQAYQLVPSGHYSATISAPGFETQTVEFDITNPTNCGCCGCPCGGTFQKTVTLEPNGEPAGGCCASLETDPNNCGECGRTCAVSGCQGGKCGPSYGQCLVRTGGFTSCDAYCESVGLSCAAACGTTGDKAMQEWSGGIANCSADPNVIPRYGSCSDPFTSGADYQCCCEER